MPEPRPESVLDLDVLEALRELGGPEDPSLLDELIDLFLDDAPKQIEGVESALAGRDIEGVERAAHTLKSSSANLGALGLSELCFDLERLGREGTLEGAQGIFERLRTAFADVKTALLAQHS